MSDLRPISLPDDKRLPLVDQPAPMLDWIDIDRLVVDDTYQRGLGKSNWRSIRRIAAEFRWSRFTPVLVAPVEGGRFAIIDGQHRTHAAALCRIAAVPCMVVHMTAQEQASAFSWVNGNVTAITGFHVYKAALAASEDWAMECRAAVEAAGCRLMTSNKSSVQKRRGEVFSIALVKEHVAAGCLDIVTKGLKALFESDTDAHPDLFANSVLKPWFSTVAASDQSQEVLTAFCAEVDLLDVLDRAAVVGKQPEYRGQSRYVIAKASMDVMLRQFVRRAAA